MKKAAYILTLLVVTLTSCDKYDVGGLFASSSPGSDSRFSQSMEWNKAHGYQSIAVPDEYKAYLCTDSHVSDSNEHVKKFVLAYRSDKDCPFAINLGDLINSKNNFPKYNEALNVYPDDYVPGKDTMFTVAGNHDLYFSQWSEFVKYYHTSSYWFETVSATDGRKLDLYIGIDSSNGTLGIDQTNWLENLLKEKSGEGYRHIIVFTHTHFFMRDYSQSHTSNFAMEETYELCDLFRRYNVELCLTGHCHYNTFTRYNNVDYLVVNALEENRYTILYVGDAILWKDYALK